MSIVGHECVGTFPCFWFFPSTRLRFYFYVQFCFVLCFLVFNTSFSLLLPRLPSLFFLFYSLFLSPYSTLPHFVSSPFPPSFSSSSFSPPPEFIDLLCYSLLRLGVCACLSPRFDWSGKLYFILFHSPPVGLH